MWSTIRREILERRAQENGVDFINGVATAITPMAYYETVMARGWRDKDLLRHHVWHER